MDDSAIAPSLMSCDLAFLFKNDDLQIGILPNQLQACSKANDPSPNYRYVAMCILHFDLPRGPGDGSGLGSARQVFMQPIAPVRIGVQLRFFQSSILQNGVSRPRHFGREL